MHTSKSCLAVSAAAVLVLLLRAADQATSSAVSACSRRAGPDKMMVVLATPPYYSWEQCKLNPHTTETTKSSTALYSCALCACLDSHFYVRQRSFPHVPCVHSTPLPNALHITQHSPTLGLSPPPPLHVLPTARSLPH